MEWMKSFELVRRGIYFTLRQHLPDLSDQELWKLVDEIIREAKSFEDLMPLTYQKIQQRGGKP